MLLATIFTVEAKDFGTYGETFPIQEKSLLGVIMNKLEALSESGKLEEHQKAIVAKTKERFYRPDPVLEVKTTTEPRAFTYDPSITVPYDLRDHKGQVFHQKGTKVNPLDTNQLRCPLLFVDGDDETQVAWAIGQHKASGSAHKPKIILVKGAPLEMSDKLQLPIYFDQSGTLVKKLGIAQVPARVSQKKKLLLIEEMNP